MIIIHQEHPRVWWIARRRFLPVSSCPNRPQRPVLRRLRLQTKKTIGESVSQCLGNSLSFQSGFSASRFNVRSPTFPFSVGQSAASNMAEYASTLQSFDSYGDNIKCPDTLCPYLGTAHFHCKRKRCLYATDQMDYLLSHAKDFHENIEILEGFQFYDRMVDCRLQGCASNKTNRWANQKLIQLAD